MTPGSPSSEIETLSESAEQVDLNSLLREFYDDFAELASFELASEIPEPFDTLLNHQSHMTVTVEHYHGEPVDVEVHRRRNRFASGDVVQAVDVANPEELDATVAYTREITLVTHDTHQVVQHGIVRLDPSALSRSVWHQIASGEIPLGRVLIENNVLRQVQLCRLWRVTAGPSLAKYLNLQVGDVVYGRTALIRCDHKPAIELLEIVRGNGPLS
ncbi:hypothetical protein LOC71_20290 [Rhodopirellula sp. JC740]|uniref:Uncharacterized protein n=1 Tax=Rhodopirellula halodulae TaxID=2894198 RepID=A0ABS8NM29_9BACT|nr:hypothetical protein [Rhodopirellula sp. JC740]MCC9644620.1 hypothetical protein [Rhodopirellula sp. JC740]